MAEPMDNPYPDSRLNTSIELLHPPFYSKTLEAFIPIGTIVVLTGGRGLVRITSYDGIPSFSDADSNDALLGNILDGVTQPEPFLAPVHPLFTGIRGRELVLS